MVVEITPDGIKNLRWKFYIVWTVLNASFVPLVYCFYPEASTTPPFSANPRANTNNRLQVVLWKTLTTTTEPIHHCLSSETKRPLRVNDLRLTRRRSLRKCGGTAVLTRLCSEEVAGSVFQDKCRNEPTPRTRPRLDQMSCGTQRSCDTPSTRTDTAHVPRDYMDSDKPYNDTNEKCSFPSTISTPSFLVP